MKTHKKPLSILLSIVSLVATTNSTFAGKEKNTDSTKENSAIGILESITSELSEERSATADEPKSINENADASSEVALQNELLLNHSSDDTIDEFISKYLDGLKNHDGETVTVPPDMIEETLNNVNEVLKSELRDIRNGIYVNVYEGDVTVVGDTHADFNCTSLIIKYFLKKLKINPDEKIIFLGDYVDRGNENVKNFIAICSLKAKFPDNVYMLKGNHENISLNEKYGLFNEFDQLYSVCGGSSQLSHKFASVYVNLPIFAILDNKIFCSHGGIPYPSDDFNYYQSKEYYSDVLWSDPWCPPYLTDSNTKTELIFDNRGFAFNYSRNIGRIFNKFALKSFLMNQNLESFVRSHQAFNLEQSQDINQEYDGKLFCVYSTSADLSRQGIWGRGYVLIYDHDERMLFYEYIKDLKDRF